MADFEDLPGEVDDIDDVEDEIFCQKCHKYVDDYDWTAYRTTEGKHFFFCSNCKKLEILEETKPDGTRLWILKDQPTITIDEINEPYVQKPLEDHRYFSPSSLGLFTSPDSGCERCFWLKQYKIWSRPSGGFPQITNGMDGVLKKHFDKYRKQKKLPPELASDSRFDNMELFADVSLLEKYQDWRNKKGLYFTNKDKNFTLRGAIDELLMKDGKVVVFDFKTKGYKPDKDKLEKDRERYTPQMNFYNFLLKKKGHETYEQAYLAYYWPEAVTDDGTVKFGTLIDEINVDTYLCERTLERAVDILNISCPPVIYDPDTERTRSVDDCDWCEFVPQPLEDIHP